MSPPTKVTGGCLCGAVRYEINFPPSHDFVKSSATCLCTQCRKQSGALAIPFHDVPLTAFTFTSPPGFSISTADPLAPNPPLPLKAYSASKGANRYFCAECGGWIAWMGGEPLDCNREGGEVKFKPEPTVEVTTGTMDEEFLLGTRDAEGKVVKGTGTGKWLSIKGQKVTWTENEIDYSQAEAEGLVGAGERFVFGSAEGVRDE